MILGQYVDPETGKPLDTSGMAPIVELELTAEEQARVAAEEAAAERRVAEARNAVLLSMGLLGSLAVVVGGVAYLLRERGSIRYRKPLRRKTVFCKSGIRYRVTAGGNVYRIGLC